MNGEKVTISDCGKALDEIEQQIEQLKRDRLALDRKIQALMTALRQVMQLKELSI